MKRGGPLKRRSRKCSQVEKKAQTRFREEVLSEPCLFSQTRPEHVCNGPLDPHHAIEKQFLKTHFSTLPTQKWDLVYDPRVGVPLCRKAHDAVTTHAAYIHREELPVRVIEWAEAWGIGWRLERECPSEESASLSQL